MLKIAKIMSAVAAVGLLTVGDISSAQAQTDWPNGPVNVIIPFAAGGGSDPQARVLFNAIAKRLNQPFTLDFRPGASGAIGTHVATQADPDGYTLLFTSPSPVVNSLFKDPPAPYNSLTDLVPVIQVSAAPTTIVARKDFVANTFDELVEYAKESPGRLSAAVGSPGGTPHLAATLIEYIADVEINKIPYSGVGAHTPDVVSGVVDIGLGYASGYRANVMAGNLKYIAVMSEERSPLMPDIPATSESQYKGVDSGGWFMIFVPAGTPQEVIDKINAEFNETLSDPEVKKIIETEGFDVKGGTAEQAKAAIDGQYKQLQSFIETTGYKF